MTLSEYEFFISVISAAYDEVTRFGIIVYERWLEEIRPFCKNVENLPDDIASQKSVRNEFLCLSFSLDWKGITIGKITEKFR